MHSPVKRILTGSLRSQEEVRHFVEDVEVLEDLLREQRALRLAELRKEVESLRAEEVDYDPDAEQKASDDLTNFCKDSETRILDLTRVIGEVLDHALMNDFVMFSDKHTVTEKVLKYKHLLKEDKYKHMIGKDITDKRRVMRNWNRYKRRFLQTRHVRFEHEVLDEILATQHEIAADSPERSVSNEQ